MQMPRWPRFPSWSRTASEKNNLQRWTIRRGIKNGAHSMEWTPDFITQYSLDLEVELVADEEHGAFVVYGHCGRIDVVGFDQVKRGSQLPARCDVI